MTRRRSILLTLLAGALALAVALQLPRPVMPGADDERPPLAQVAPDAAPPGATRLVRHAHAAADDDVEALAELTRANDYAAYQAARHLARMEDADPELRLAAYERELDLRIDDPLDRAERRALHVEVARLAEALGRTRRATLAFREALPEQEAIEGLKRLGDDPYQLANLFLQADLDEEALDALGELSAPSIEAPAYRALGRYEEALDAYRRWLAQVPGHRGAREGVAWSHWYLEDLAAADAAFAALGGPRALYGRALVANRRGDREAGVDFLLRAGAPTHLWLATGWLEEKEKEAAAIEVYLDLAGRDSAYADDAAYRAYVLAGRLGNDEARAEAERSIPEGSYFDLRLGGDPALPDRDDLAQVRPAALDTAGWLAELGDETAARGVLSFALRDALAPDMSDAPPTESGAATETKADEATVVALGEALVALGEYRRPSRAASRFVNDGSRQYRTWRLAWPRAWEGLVRAEAKEADVPPELVWAVMRQESAFFPRAVSRSGAQGLMQVMPSTWDWIAELQEEPPGDPFDAATNIRYGTHYLGWLRDYFRGDLELVVPSYNRGQGYIGRLYDGEEVRRDKDDLLREIDALETREYLQAVWTNVRVYQGLDRMERQGGPPGE
ncbi:MAG: lytic transglycosylase domain-containing protein [Trueperaceae bacterium]|nr:lytic transglycosylase domain-containing protein [Trueperaceae bacterium]